MVSALYYTTTQPSQTKGDMKMAIFYRYEERKERDGETAYIVLISNNEMFYPQTMIAFDSERDALDFMHSCVEND